MISQSKGNAQVNINQSKLKAALIAVPPISEQKRIVKYIQEIFDVIELLENNQNDYTELVELLNHPVLHFEDLCQKQCIISPKTKKKVSQKADFQARSALSFQSSHNNGNILLCSINERAFISLK